MSRSILVVPLIVGLVFSWAALPCTTAAIPKSPTKIVTKSYDWHWQTGHLIVNPSGYHKTAFVLPWDKKNQPAEWWAKHSSVTFNQYGREFPLGGMNDAGLVVEIMMLPESSYPPGDDRKTVNELQWIQYQLDRWSTVEEMVQHKDDIRIAKVDGQVHYLACDSTGDCASFEAIGGRNLVATKAPTLTNDPQSRSLQTLKEYVGFGGHLPIPQTPASLDRYVFASSMAKAFEKDAVADPVMYAFTLLKGVQNGWHTKWNIVYETTSQQIHFKTQKSPLIKSFDASDLYVSCESPAKLLDVNTEREVRFVNYTEGANLANIKLALKGVDKFPPGTDIVLSQYPNSLSCEPEGSDARLSRR